MQNRNKNVLSIILTALFAALSAALSQLAIPVNAVPVVFTQVSIFLAAGLLGWKWGTLSQLLFAVMGAIGLPVFAGMRGGWAYVIGPTGGFILGYILAALVVGLLLQRFGRSFKVVLPVLLLGTLLIYLPGLPWLAHVTRMETLRDAFLFGMLPYLPGDLLKVALCSALIPKLYQMLHNKLP